MERGLRAPARRRDHPAQCRQNALPVRRVARRRSMSTSGKTPRNSRLRRAEMENGRVCARTSAQVSRHSGTDPPLIAGLSPTHVGRGTSPAWRLGHARPRVRAGGQICLRAGARLHAAGGTRGKLRRAARPPRLRARRGGAGQRARLRQPRRARCAGALARSAARCGHHGRASRARRIAGLAPRRHTRPALSPVLSAGRRATCAASLDAFRSAGDDAR
jgi:hypothetical protein